MNKTILFRAVFFMAALLLAAGLSISSLWQPAQPARGKSSATPISDIALPEQLLAQELALEDERVAYHTMGWRTEVLSVRYMVGQFTPDSRECETSECYQVEIYDFDRNGTVTAIVDVPNNLVRDVYYLANSQPGVNRRLAVLAAELASAHPEIIEALGYRPRSDGLAAPGGGMEGTSCDGRHLCVGIVYHQPEGLVTAIVDLTLEEVVGVTQVAMPPDPPRNEAPFVPENCPAPGTVERDGWQLSYQTTNWDGLRVHTVSYNGMPVINNIKLVEWHIRYASGSGFVDITGCNSGGGGFHIYPYGETQVLDLYDDQMELVGFEVVQDFRMNNWGANCSYRYEQRIHFYEDGRFRVTGGAYGRGCSTIGVYRPVVRIDIAVNGSDNNNFAIWDGEAWETQDVELWELQENGLYTPEGYRWLLYNQDGNAFYVEPGKGQFPGSPEADNAYIYVTMHRPNEGDTDMPMIGVCCNTDHQQGPHNYVNGDPIQNQNLVIWYVAQMEKYGVAPGPYKCWTVTAGANPETYPCFSGPMFVPAVIARYGLELDTADAAQMGEPGETITYTLAITNTGNVSDTFHIDLSDNEWATSAPLTLTLGAGQMGEFFVTVAVPPTAVAGDSDSVTVAVTSQNDETATAALVLTTTAVINEHLLYLPILLLD